MNQHFSKNLVMSDGPITLLVLINNCLANKGSGKEVEHHTFYEKSLKKALAEFDPCQHSPNNAPDGSGFDQYSLCHTAFVIQPLAYFFLNKARKTTKIPNLTEQLLSHQCHSS